VLVVLLQFALVTMTRFEPPDWLAEAVKVTGTPTHTWVGLALALPPVKTPA
jgi:hypothetical protein